MFLFSLRGRPAAAAVGVEVQAAEEERGEGSEEVEAEEAGVEEPDRERWEVVVAGEEAANCGGSVRHEWDASLPWAKFVLKN